MTEQDIIEQARDVLKRRRDVATAGPWKHSYDPNAYPRSGFQGGYEVFEADTPETASLIRIVSDPDLLDALDRLLSIADGPGTAFTDQRVAAERIAIAIVAADEGMEQQA